MKKIIYTMLAAASLGLASCEYDDKDVWNAINSQEERIAALENWQKTANENINALQALVNENDYITAVTPLIEEGETIGYTISFLKQGDVTIYNGEKGDQGDKGETGDKGDMPLIGVVEQTDGRWYWTLNGELLKDANGNPICANGKDGEDGEDGTDGGNGSSGTSAPVPQLKAGSELGTGYEAATMYLSVDGGNTWTKVSGQDGNSFFKEAPRQEGNSWVFTLKNNTEIIVPQYTQLLLEYADEKITDSKLVVPAEIPFEIQVTSPDGYHWSCETIEGQCNFERKGNLLNFKGMTSENSATILFTLIAEDNQASFYQVTIIAKQPATIEKKENPTLAEALVKLPGVETNASGDAIITPKVIEQTKSLDLKESNITSLAGLEAFTNLETLNCQNNDLTEIDLSILPLLTELDCSGNKLTQLDLSGQTELVSLNCSNCFNTLQVRGYSNGILNVSDCPNLEILKCRNNNLSELDVTKNLKLVCLDCINNPLIKLDISNNELLKELYMVDTSISDLDLSNNPLLEKLDVHSAMLTKLDISNNTNLTFLHCGNNQMTILDIRKNTLLENLECGNQQDNRQLILVLNAEQKIQWEKDWIQNGDRNVTISESPIENAEGSGSDFTNGGSY